MKRQIRMIAVAAVLMIGTAHAEIKNLDAIMAKAKPDETKNLGKLLQQFRIVPAKDPTTRESVLKIVWVETGSVFDREGLKPGDFVTSNSMGTSSRKMELTNTLKSKDQEQRPSAKSP